MAHFLGEEAGAYSEAFAKLGFKAALAPATRRKMESLFGECLGALKSTHAVRAHQYASQVFRHFAGPSPFWKPGTL